MAENGRARNSYEQAQYERYRLDGAIKVKVGSKPWPSHAGELPGEVWFYKIGSKGVLPEHAEKPAWSPDYLADFYGLDVLGGYPTPKPKAEEELVEFIQVTEAKAVQEKPTWDKRVARFGAVTSGLLSTTAGIIAWSLDGAKSHEDVMYASGLTLTGYGTLYAAFGPRIYALWKRALDSFAEMSYGVEELVHWPEFVSESDAHVPHRKKVRGRRR